LSGDELISWASFLETGGEISPLSLVGDMAPPDEKLHEEIILKPIELYKKKESSIRRFFTIDQGGMCQQKREK
jgi:hypothetical protein